MKELNKVLEEYIRENDYYHHLFTNVDKDEIELIKEKIMISPFFDLILEFDDYDKINDLIKDIPSSNPRREAIINRIVEDYLYFKIIENANIEEYDAEKIKECLYSGSYNEYTKMEVLIWMFIEREIEDLGLKSDGKKARLHFFVDSVWDAKLQHKINDLYASRTKIVMMEYTSNNNLISYSSDIGGFIEDPHDYVTHDMKRK